MTVKLYDQITPNQFVILDLPFFEGAGTVVHDLSRYHNNGTFPGAPNNPAWGQLASGEWVLQYDGNNDAVVIPDSALWALGALDFSFEIWVNEAALTAARAILTQTQAIGVNTMGFNGDAGQFRFGIMVAGVNQVVSSPAAAMMGFTAANWHHIILTRSAVTAWTLYCDMNSFAMTGDTGLNIPNFGADLVLGCLDIGGPIYLNSWDGSLSRPRLYLNHALTPAEIVSHYTAERVLYP